jgi:hypothetical protein
MMNRKFGRWRSLPRGWNGGGVAVVADAASDGPNWVIPAVAAAAPAPWIKRRRENKPLFPLTFNPP